MATCDNEDFTIFNFHNGAKKVKFMENISQ